jgi:hypothetical protein
MVGIGKSRDRRVGDFKTRYPAEARRNDYV